MGWTPTPHYHRKSRQWYCRLQRHTYYFGRDQAEAHKRFAAKLVELGIVVRDSVPLTVGGAAKAWHQEHGGEWRMRMLAYWTEHQGDVALAELSADALTMLVQKLSTCGLGPQTIRHVVNHASRVCRWAVAKGWLAKAPDPAALPAVPTNPRDVDPARLYKAFEKLRMPIYRFCLETGCRPGEACRLEWSHVRLDQATCELPPGAHKTGKKTGRPRTIYLSPTAAALLRSIRPPADATGHVFIDVRGKPYTSQGMRSTLRHHGITPYQLRHTRAQSLLDSGTPIDEVAALLGHSGLRTVQRYAQVRDQPLKKRAKKIRSPLG